MQDDPYLRILGQLKTNGRSIGGTALMSSTELAKALGVDPDQLFRDDRELGRAILGLCATGRCWAFPFPVKFVASGSKQLSTKQWTTFFGLVPERPQSATLDLRDEKGWFFAPFPEVFDSLTHASRVYQLSQQVALATPRVPSLAIGVELLPATGVRTMTFQVCIRDTPPLEVPFLDIVDRYRQMFSDTIGAWRVGVRDVTTPRRHGWTREKAVEIIHSTAAWNPADDSHRIGGPPIGATLNTYTSVPKQEGIVVAAGAGTHALQLILRPRIFKQALSAGHGAHAG